jgi:23S rRNA (pseudouridine1915-N3)-methyltransferase
VAARVPGWVHTGYVEYERRLTGSLPLNLQEIKPASRTGGDRSKWQRIEWERIQAVLPKVGVRVALDERGQQWSSTKLAEQLDRWRHETSDIAFMIGGADGLDGDCIGSAQCVWSLSALTLPHALVRIVLVEQLYRAWSILNGHPYHRI